MSIPARLSPAAVLAVLRQAGLPIGRASGRLRDQHAGVTARKVSAWHVGVFAPSREAAEQCCTALRAAGLEIQRPNLAGGCFQVSRSRV